VNDHGASFRPTARLGLVLLLSALVVATPAAAVEDCTECHDTDPEAFAETVHAFLDCLDCHQEAEGPPHPETALPPDCATCHEDVVAEWESSVHGGSRLSGHEEAPACADCHGAVHTLLPSSDPESPLHHDHIAGTCGSCHADPEMVEKFGIPVVKPLAAYEASVHGRQVAEGGDAATCSDCHGTHAIQGSGDPRSPVFHQRVPQTCGQCHSEIAQAYEASVHGSAAAHGAREAPVCTDCHGEHRILSPSEPGSPVYATNVPKMTCGRCHGDIRLADKFGIDPDKVPAYQDSYHGLASRAGVTTVANCGSCHGVHDIQPSSDPRSHVHPDNLAETCGRCHPGANAMVAKGPVHVLPGEKGHVAVFLVREIYLWMIWITIGGMVLHNVLDFRRKMKNPPIRTLAPTASDEQRMLPGFRIAHVLMMVSFATLVYTGFALTYPESWWARPLLRWEEGFGLRGWLHRAAAILMLVSLAVHVVHLAIDRRARACIARMRPTLHDVREFKERMLYYLGRRDRPPEAEELGYPEKMEYIALMWGCVVMAVTGFMLWFENPMLRWFPKWVGDVATAIHFYEAVLASLAIVVWHFYFVIFDPVVYPMDTAWLTGRAPLGRVLERRASGGARPNGRAEPGDPESAGEGSEARRRETDGGAASGAV
jgi:cytochrome b subunit of formate dehydrogenase